VRGPAGRSYALAPRNGRQVADRAGARQLKPRLFGDDAHSPHCYRWHQLTGNATNGVDYQRLPLSVTIPAGVPSTTITVKPIKDTAVELPENVILTLSPSSAYVLGAVRLSFLGGQK
jgi:hypothetical protein